MEFQLEKSATLAGKNCINTKQIKSTTDNNGDFSNENNSILYSRADNRQDVSPDMNDNVESVAAYAAEYSYDENGKNLWSLFEKTSYDEESQKTINKHTDKSIYKKENIEGRVYIHEERIPLDNATGEVKKIFEKEKRLAHKFSDRFDCDVFMLPPGSNNNPLYIAMSSNPDTISLGVFLELKESRQGTKSSIGDRLRDGLKQSENIYLDILEGEISKNTDDAVRGRLKESGYDGVTVILSDKNGVFKKYTQNNKELEVSSLFDGPGAKPRSNSNVSSPFAHVKVNRMYSLSIEAQCQYDDVVAKYKGTD